MDEDKVKQYTADSDKWEDGTFGENEEHVVAVNDDQDAALDEALQLQMISIRLPKKMIEDMKFLARAHGIGYQPLMRDVLQRFIVHEKKAIIKDALERRAKEEEECKADEAQTLKEIEVLEERRKVA